MLRDKSFHKIYHTKGIENVSIPGDVFQSLFNLGKLGSKEISYTELEALHKIIDIKSTTDNFLIHIQEISHEEVEEQNMYDGMNIPEDVVPGDAEF